MNYFSQAISWTKSNRAALALGLLAVITFGYFYWNNPFRPHAQSDIKASWVYWFDQGEYLKEAKAIHAGRLDRSQYSYPMGYPMLGAVTVGWFHSDPFLIFNVAIFVATIVVYFLIASRLFSFPVAFLSSLLLLMATPLLTYSVVPWTTTATLPLMMILLYLAFVSADLSYGAVVGLALLALLAYMARGGGELALLAPLVLAIGWKFRHEPEIFKKVGLGVVILLAGAALNALWTKAIFGSYLHPYLKAVTVVGFQPKSIPRSFFRNVVYSGAVVNFYPPLLTGGFWLALAPIGGLLALLDRRRRWLHFGLIASIVLGFGVVSSFNAFTPETLKFNSLHYVKIWLPALALYATYAVVALMNWAKSAQVVPSD